MEHEFCSVRLVLCMSSRLVGSTTLMVHRLIKVKRPNITEFNQSLMAESHHQGNFTALKSQDGKWCEITYFVCLFVCAVKSSDGLSV